jgi:hypothetical protein
MGSFSDILFIVLLKSDIESRELVALKGIVFVRSYHLFVTGTVQHSA